MTAKKAARHRCHSERAKNQRPGALTSSIVSNHEAFVLVASSTVFALVMVAIPTVMALMKQWGWW